MGSGREPVRIGLALGGGMLRGLAHIGVLRGLEGAGVPIAAVAGASTGAMVAALYAVGWTPDQMAELATSLRPRDVYDPHLHPLALARLFVKAIADAAGVRLRWSVPLGLMKGDRLESLLREWTRGATLPDVRLPTAIVAADLRSRSRVVFAGPRPLQPAELERITAAARGQVAGEGPLERPAWRTATASAVELAAAVRASIAIPGVFAPKELGGWVLVDGGVVDNVPADLLPALGATRRVAVDVSVHRPTPALDDLWEIVVCALDLMGAELTRLRGQADLVLRPPVPDAGLFDFDKISDIIAAGEAAARAALPQLRAWLEAPAV